MFAVGTGVHEYEQFGYELIHGTQEINALESCESNIGATALAAECEEALSEYRQTTGSVIRGVALDGLILYGLAEGVMFMRRRKLVEQPEDQKV